MNDLTRAISIRQAWVELILCGEKQGDYRSRPTRIRGRVYIYASLTPADSTSAWKKTGKQPGELPTGQIVGTVEIVRLPLGCQPGLLCVYSRGITAPFETSVCEKPATARILVS